MIPILHRVRDEAYWAGYSEAARQTTWVVAVVVILLLTFII